MNKDIDNNEKIEFSSSSKEYKLACYSVILAFLSTIFLIFTLIPSFTCAVIALIKFKGNFTKEAIVGKRIAYFGLILDLVYFYYAFVLTRFFISFFL